MTDLVTYSSRLFTMHAAGIYIYTHIWSCDHTPALPSAGLHQTQGVRLQRISSLLEQKANGIALSSSSPSRRFALLR